MWSKRIGSGVLIFLLSTTLAGGALPRVLEYAGTLFDEGGNPLTAEANFRFSLWKSATIETGDIDENGALNEEASNFAGFQEVQTLTPEREGEFFGLVGKVVDLPVLELTEPKFLQVETKLTGEPNTAYEVLHFNDTFARKPLTQTAFALQAEAAEKTFAETFVLNADSSDSGEESVILKFGNYLNKFLKWDATQVLFEFSHKLKVGGDLLVQGKVGIGDLTPDGDLKLDVEGKIGATQICKADGTQCVPTGSRVKVKVKTIAFSPAYPNAVGHPDGSDNDKRGKFEQNFDYLNFENYYSWSSPKSQLRDYDLVLRFLLPRDFQAWDESKAVSFRYKTQYSDAKENKLDFRMFDTANKEIAFSGNEGLFSSPADTWQTFTVASMPTKNKENNDAVFTAGEFVTLKIKFYSKKGGKAYAGSLVFQYSAL